MPRLPTSANDYSDLVNSAVSFSGQEQEFFVNVKLQLLKSLLYGKLGALAGVRALDLGCGTGSSHADLLSERIILYGVDLDYDSLRIAHQRFPQTSHVLFDGQNIPFRDGTFDFLFAICVLHHVNPIERPAIMAEAARVLRPGGVIVIGEHNPFNPLTRLAVWRCEFDVDVKLLSSTEAVGRLKAAGFKSVEKHFTLLFPFHGGAFRAIERALDTFPVGAQYLAAGVK